MPARSSSARLSKAPRAPVHGVAHLAAHVLSSRHGVWLFHLLLTECCVAQISAPPQMGGPGMPPGMRPPMGMPPPPFMPPPGSACTRVAARSSARADAKATLAVPPPGFRPGMPPPGFVPGSTHPLARSMQAWKVMLTLPRRARSASAWLPPRDASAWRVSAGRLSSAGLPAAPAGPVRRAQLEQSTAQRLDFWCIHVTHSCSQCPSEGRCVCVCSLRLTRQPDTTVRQGSWRGCLKHSRARSPLLVGRAVACMGWTRGRALALALQLALGAVLSVSAWGQEWQVAAVRVNAGPLNPTQAAVRAVNATFVRAEQKRFWLGCRQLSIVGFNSYTLIEQAAEERL